MEGLGPRGAREAALALLAERPRPTAILAMGDQFALAAIDANTPDPDGGIVEKDAAGRPTGVLRENAAGLVAVKIPAASVRVSALSAVFETR